MKILFALSEYHRRGGFPRHGVNLALALARRGNDVTVLCRRAETEPDDGVLQFRFFEVPERPLWRHLWAEPRALTRAVQAVRGDFDATIALGVSVFAPVTLVAPGTQRGYFRTTTRLLPRTSPRRWVEMVRPFHRILMASERAMLRGAHPAQVVVGGAQFVAEYTEPYGYPAERVLVIPHGVELDEFRFDPPARERVRGELGVASGEILLVNMANRARQKGLDTIAAALPLLPREPAWTMAFAGEGSLSPMLRRRTAALQREGRVKLLGRVPSAAALLSAADIVVFPSRYDPWGMVVTEALAAGAPTLCSAHIGSATAIRPGVNGDLLQDPSNAHELAGRLHAMMARRWDREAVAASVCELTWDRSAALLEQALAHPVVEAAR